MPQEIEEKGSRILHVLRVEPGKYPQYIDLEDTLENLQREVGGWIQLIHPFTDPEVGIVCNDDGKLIGLPLNRGLKDEKGQLYDAIAGNFLIVGTPRWSDSFAGLTKEQGEKYSKEFWYPEKFVRFPDGIRSLKYKPERNPMER